MKLVDFSSTIRVLELPHPFLADNGDVQGIFGRTCVVEEEADGPNEQNDGDTEGDGGPN